MIKKLVTAACLTAMASMATAATTWTMSTEQPDNNYLTQNARQFAEDIKEATDGQLIINVQSNSVLLKRPEVKRGVQQGVVDLGEMLVSTIGDRKSTRLNSSHVAISYAVFCLKKNSKQSFVHATS